MRIFLSEDEMLNSKNEYLANCLSRVLVSEDRFERENERAERRLRREGTPGKSSQTEE